LELCAFEPLTKSEIITSFLFPSGSVSKHSPKAGPLELNPRGEYVSNFFPAQEF